VFVAQDAKTGNLRVVHGRLPVSAAVACKLGSGWQVNGGLLSIQFVVSDTLVID